MLDSTSERVHPRGGLATKFHALVDAGGLPIVLKITKARHPSVAAPPTCAYDPNALRQTMTHGQLAIALKRLIFLKNRIASILRVGALILHDGLHRDDVGCLEHSVGNQASLPSRQPAAVFKPVFDFGDDGAFCIFHDKAATHLLDPPGT